tara:strand:+ start:96508 stop:97191 length:684 start_codon:yes stop_codon:yes gene_type:complete
MLYSILIGSPLLVVLTVIYLNHCRRKDIETIDLEPNCLLTKHPIVFVPGKKSLFFYGDYWGFIPFYLREHGYEVYELKLSWRQNDRRQQEIKQQLTEIVGRRGPVHLVADATSKEEILFAQNECSHLLQSLWVNEPGETLLNSGNASLQPTKIPIRGLKTFDYKELASSQPLGWLPRLSLLLHKWLMSEHVNIQLLQKIHFHPLQNAGRPYLRWAVSMAEKEHMGHL